MPTASTRVGTGVRMQATAKSASKSVVTLATQVRQAMAAAHMKVSTTMSLVLPALSDHLPMMMDVVEPMRK